MEKIMGGEVSGAIETRHLYEYAVDPASATAGAHVIHFVGAAKRVLEIGCGPGSITRILAEQRQCRVTGIEMDPDAIEKVAPYCEAVIRADLNDPGWLELVAEQPPFDVVVAADVLEHLYNPRETLGRMVRLIGPEGYLVISLPHVCHAAVAACLIEGNFQYRDWGLLDKTHIRFFGLVNIQELLAQAGLKIIDYKFVIKLPEETEFADTWRRLSGSQQKVLRNHAHSDIYQVVVKAVPIGYPGTPLLFDPPPHKDAALPSATWKRRLRAGIASRLNQRAKARIRSLLHYFGLNP